MATWSDLEDREPAHGRVAGVDLVVVRDGEDVSVLHGRCLYRGVLLSNGHVEGENLICGVHGWDCRFDIGTSEYDNSEQLATFTVAVNESEDAVLVDAAEVRSWAADNPQPYEEPEGNPAEAGDGAIQAIGCLRVRACGHDSLAGFEHRDLTAWKRDVAELTRVEYAGVGR